MSCPLVVIPCGAKKADHRAPAAALPLDDAQAYALRLVEERWPSEDMARRGLALCEEAGEVARCLLKAGANHSGYRADTDWDAQLRIEVGQVAFVLLTIAEAAGFSLREALGEAVMAVERKPTLAERSDECPECGRPVSGDNACMCVFDRT